MFSHFSRNRERPAWLRNMGSRALFCLQNLTADSYFRHLTCKRERFSSLLIDSTIKINYQFYVKKTEALLKLFL